MKNTGLSSSNVEKALETLYSATTIDPDGEVVAAYWVLKEFLQVVKEGVMNEDVGVLLRKKD